MEPIDRRAFLRRGSVVVAAAGVAATLPAQFASAATKTANNRAITATSTGLSPTAELAGESSTQTVIAHVRSFESGEIAIFAGDQEVVLHDRGLASQLARASKGGR